MKIDIVIANNNIGDKGAIEIGKTLMINNSLTILDLDGGTKKLKYDSIHLMHNEMNK